MSRDDTQLRREANLLAAAARLVADAVDEGPAADLGHGPSAPAGLVTIGNYPGLTVDALRRALGLTHSGAVRLVDRLEADGFVRRDRRGRAVALSLTARGRRRTAGFEAARLRAAAEVLAPLRPDDRARLAALLEPLLAARPAGDDDLRRICRLCSHGACEPAGHRCPVAAAVAGDGHGSAGG